MGDADKLMDVESGNKEAHEEELPSDDDEGGKVGFKLTIKWHDFFYFIIWKQFSEIFLCYYLDDKFCNKRNA